MNAPVQRDFLVEADERELLKRFPSLQSIADALPSNPILKTFDVGQALNISQHTILKWIWAHKFTYYDLTTGEKAPRYGVERKSFLAFLATRLNRVK